MTSDEARTGLLVEKRRLSFFPPEGEPFALNGRTVSLCSHACTCRGPDLPHRHWTLPVGGLTAGETVEIRRKAPGRYELTRS
ncbi:MAG: hypothetical protein ACXWZP_00505 [Gaiellaceae bacterium]